MRTPFFDLRADRRGVIAIITVIVIAAIILAIGVTASFIGQTEVTMSGDVDRAHTASSVAASCVEEAMHRLKLNSGYTGGSLTVSGNSCTIVVSGSGSSRTIVVTATVTVYTKVVTVTASLRQNAALSSKAWGIASWLEGDPP